MMMVMMMGGIVVRVNVNVNRMRLRELKWAGSRLQIIKRIHDKQESPDLEFFGICLLGQIPDDVHAESLFFHLISVTITEKSLAQQLGLVVSTNDEIVVQIS